MAALKKLRKKSSTHSRRFLRQEKLNGCEKAIMQVSGIPRICPNCGSAAMAHQTLSGAEYLLPVAPEYLTVALQKMDSQALLRDRLQRAEKIIVDLRQRLSEKK